jgi:hypothetical protein
MAPVVYQVHPSYYVQQLVSQIQDCFSRDVQIYGNHAEKYAKCHSCGMHMPLKLRKTKKLRWQHWSGLSLYYSLQCFVL